MNHAKICQRINRKRWIPRDLVEAKHSLCVRKTQIPHFIHDYRIVYSKRFQMRKWYQIDDVMTTWQPCQSNECYLYGFAFRFQPLWFWCDCACPLNWPTTNSLKYFRCESSIPILDTYFISMSINFPTIHSGIVRLWMIVLLFILNNLLFRFAFVVVVVVWPGISITWNSYVSSFYCE